MRRALLALATALRWLALRLDRLSFVLTTEERCETCGELGWWGLDDEGDPAHWHCPTCETVARVKTEFPNRWDAAVSGDYSGLAPPLVSFDETMRAARGARLKDVTPGGEMLVMGVDLASGPDVTALVASRTHRTGEKPALIVIDEAATVSAELWDAAEKIDPTKKLVLPLAAPEAHHPTCQCWICRDISRRKP